ncbi:2581_t:CDS:2 [Diversispora eburnea]|uniref:DNA topoisomerase (ATP-hydrolyzing) n=1 Tax=Diversispora eburnea TaxID=1213867 RepID=A0A9N8Z850_9GLOM|nr:2581_t:CDS:2 [Diversispora eburnea]
MSNSNKAKPQMKRARKDNLVQTDMDIYIEASSSKATSVQAIPQAAEKTVEEIYQKKSQLEHILLRPDTYIGSAETIAEKLWVYDSESDTMKFKEVNIVPGLYKIVDEILVNAADNKVFYYIY